MTGFKALPGKQRLRLTIDGSPVEAPEGASVAAALLLAGHTAFGPHPVSGEPEGPWCLIGVCFGCLVEIDGVKDRQACLVRAKEGMAVRTRPERG
jgi:NADH dehydrogenase/NADH:ubiquinone oxidoreductase subunit G